eukprot:CAMPEP_0116139608 /NCGR_PEP_ID=MMETSP0329-20121206/13402_1 /TAXON_ID=697910 /ORGANISM="Pseudo-nitzschia arenysensis, Strain B593" /LENGTH=430 /DNA_ID=CAMNT_0003634661 /DNA_START=267 /DNA_END=1559 /DNA_ORIENTATION=-
MIYNRLSPLLLVIAVAVLPLFVKVEALTRRPGAVSIEAASFQRRIMGDDKNSVAFVVSAARGGTATEDSDGGVEAEVDEEEDETDAEEEIVESIEEVVNEVAEEIAEAIEEVIEEVVEEVVEEIVEEDAAEVVAEEVDEEDEVVFPTDEIPSDDVRSFHTTDGELADDEGVYTDGQNESPIADNEPAEDTIVATEETANGGDDDDEEVDEDEESAAIGATAVRAGASVAVIDEETKNVLITDLRYTEEDVANMRPEIALDVVNNKLARPTEGMPKNWYIDQDAATSKPSILAKKKGLIVTVAVVGAAAISIGVLKDNDAIGDTVEDIVDALQAIPKSVAAVVVAAKNSVTGGVSTKKKAPALKPAPVSKKDTETSEEEDEESETKDTSVQSIKPGTTPNEVPDPDIDTTWLDKMLTRIGGVFKSFLNIKI